MKKLLEVISTSSSSRTTNICSFSGWEREKERVVLVMCCSGWLICLINVDHILRILGWMMIDRRRRREKEKRDGSKEKENLIPSRGGIQKMFLNVVRLTTRVVSIYLHAAAACFYSFLLSFSISWKPNYTVLSPAVVASSLGWMDACTCKRTDLVASRRRQHRSPLSGEWCERGAQVHEDRPTFIVGVCVCMCACVRVWVCGVRTTWPS